LQINISKQEHFMSLYQPLHARLSRFVQTLVWDNEEAKDVVSETVLVAFESFEKLENENAFLSYLFSIASNLVNKKLRRKKFWGLFDTDKAANKPDNLNSESSLMKYELNKALKRLPTKQSEALVWYEISGLSMDEIAIIHGITVNGVKTNISRARKTLALWLEKDETQSVKNMKGVWYEQ
jgi:RNA polymerase sigma-70 factor (ECF subfamily)